jgi:dATP pyrophosphohydrolase
MHEDGAARAQRHKIPESVLVIIHTADLEVLLIERADHPGYWQSVTGSRDWADEPLAATAAREVAEETGIVVGSTAVPAENLRDWDWCIDYEIFPIWRHRYAPGVTRNTEHRFGLQVPRDIPVVLDPREHTAWRWLPWQDAAAACFSWSNAAAIRALPDRLGQPPVNRSS